MSYTQAYTNMNAVQEKSFLPFFYRDSAEHVSSRDRNKTIFTDTCFDYFKKLKETVSSRSISTSQPFNRKASIWSTTSRYPSTYAPTINIDAGTRINQFGWGNTVNANNYTTHYHHSDSSRRREKEKDDLPFLLIGLVASAIFGMVAYVGGSAYSSYFKANDNVQETEQFKENFYEHSKIEGFLGTDPSQDLRYHGKTHWHARKIEDLTKCAEELFKNERAEIRIKMILVATIATGAAITILGCVAASSAVTLGGVVVIGAGCVASLFKLGMGDLKEQKNKDLAAKINEHVDELLSCTNRDLKQSWTKFVPFYPQFSPNAEYGFHAGPHTFVYPNHAGQPTYNPANPFVPPSFTAQPKQPQGFFGWVPFFSQTPPVVAG